MAKTASFHILVHIPGSHFRKCFFFFYWFEANIPTALLPKCEKNRHWLVSRQFVWDFFNDSKHCRIKGAFLWLWPVGIAFPLNQGTWQEGTIIWFSYSINNEGSIISSSCWASSQNPHGTGAFHMNKLDRPWTKSQQYKIWLKYM